MLTLIWVLVWVPIVELGLGSLVLMCLLWMLVFRLVCRFLICLILVGWFVTDELLGIGICWLFGLD